MTRLLDVLYHDALDVRHCAANAIDGVRARIMIPVVHALCEDLRASMSCRSPSWAAQEEPCARASQIPARAILQASELKEHCTPHLRYEERVAANGG